MPGLYSTQRQSEGGGFAGSRLAVLHHIAVFGLVALLAMEGLALKDIADGPARLVRVDTRFGLTAGLVFVIGACRGIWGGEGWAFYEADPLLLGQARALRGHRPGVDRAGSAVHRLAQSRGGRRCPHAPGRRAEPGADGGGDRGAAAGSAGGLRRRHGEISVLTQSSLARRQG